MKCSHFEGNIIKYDCGAEACDITTESEIILHIIPTENVRCIRSLCA